MQTSLIIGGDSTIGTALAAALRKEGVNVRTTSRRKQAKDSITLDLADAPENWPDLPAADVAFLCAAITKLEVCESDPEGTVRVNVDNMQELAEALLAQGTYVIFLSSNQVYDGSISYRHPDEPTCPLNEYGRQKSAMETWLTSRPYPAAVLRLTKVIAHPLAQIGEWSRALKEGKPVEAFSDLRFAPVPLESVIQALMTMARHPQPGMYQLSGMHDISYYDIAHTLAMRLDVNPARIVPLSAQTKGIRPQFLPAHGTLMTSKEFAHIHVPDPLVVVGL
jgi:dTDP-4-dehydrorhamnose reductase